MALFVNDSSDPQNRLVPPEPIPGIPASEASELLNLALSGSIQPYGVRRTETPSEGKWFVSLLEALVESDDRSQLDLLKIAIREAGTVRSRFFAVFCVAEKWLREGKGIDLNKWPWKRLAAFPEWIQRNTGEGSAGMTDFLLLWDCRKLFDILVMSWFADGPRRLFSEIVKALSLRVSLSAREERDVIAPGFIWFLSAISFLSHREFIRKSAAGWEGLLPDFNKKLGSYIDYIQKNPDGKDLSDLIELRKEIEDIIADSGEDAE